MTHSSDDDPMAGPGEEQPDRQGRRLAAVPATEPHLDALRRAYLEGRPRLWRALLAWSGSTDVADEAVAEAFAQAVRRGEEIRDAEAWVWRAAFRIAAGDLARRRRDGDRSVELDHLDLAQPDSPLARSSEAVDLLRALQTLPDQQRRAVVLTDGAGFPAAEAARLLGTSATTVRVQTTRARRRLRSLLHDTAEDVR